MVIPAGTTFSHHDGSSTAEIVDTIVASVYEASHIDIINKPFYTLDRFIERVRGYVRAPGFGLAVAYIEHKPVGQAFGYALPPAARWWQGLTALVPEGFTNETGVRTFALNELMVVPEWQGQGVAHALHDELLGSRREARATLLVRENNTSAQTAYARWGWQKIGKLQPYPDSPHFDAMVLPLPLWHPA